MRPTPNRAPAPPVRDKVQLAWQPVRLRKQSQLGPATFRFLNVKREIVTAADWNNSAWDKLWLYNLHYFDDLNAERADERAAWHRALVQRWIYENPPGTGNGWEPYPLSLRIVNWIKWSLSGAALSHEALHSLAIQTRYLASRLEYHLLGNHLFANAKALVFGGLFFEGFEAQKWRSTGLKILAAQLPEQILPDGGHFERSPMYHNIILEDVLDLLNLKAAFPTALTSDDKSPSATWARYGLKMLSCTRAMSHPDGEIALLNDSAIGIAAPVSALETYAKALGIEPNERNGVLTHLSETGYIQIQIGDAWALLDVGEIGPDYLPGHAHADTLTFELSIGGRRVIVDSGTSTYAGGAERLRQRSTAAHNTVEIDATSSSEVWGSFRVARRARPFRLEVLRSNDMIRVRCAHDGYARLRGRPIHSREWAVDPTGLIVRDTIDGAFNQAVARFRFHPDCTVIRCDESSGELAIGAGRTLRWSIETGRGRVVESSYHPQFGMGLACKCLEIELGRAMACTRFTWAP